MRPDFKKELIAKLEKAAPELKGKVQAGAVDAETPAPYAAFTTPEETPLRTIHGIAGIQTTFEIAVFHTKLAAVEVLKERVIATLDLASLAGRRCTYRSSEYGFYADYNIHGYTITFRIT